MTEGGRILRIKLRFILNSLGGGGAEKVLVELLKQLDPNEYDIHLLTVAGGVPASSIPSHVHCKQIVSVKSERSGCFLRKVVRKMPPWLFKLLFLHGEYDYNIAYLEGTPTRFLAALPADAKKIAFIHCDLSTKNLIAPFYKDDDEILAEYRSFDRVCFVSQQCMEGFQRTFGGLDNACVVHNVLNYDLIRSRAREEDPHAYQTEGLKLITVGRLSEPKAYDRLLRVVSELEKDFNFQLWIVGEGDERKKLEDLIRERDIRSVSLLGYQTNPYSFMSKADLYVCSSIYEGYSTVVTEALTLALPVLTTDCAGMNEILDGGEYGMIVSNTEEALKEGLTRFLSSPDIYQHYKQKALEKSSTLSNQIAIREFGALFEADRLFKQKNEI